jgi:hypothetical protein
LNKHLKYAWYVLRHKWYVLVECHKAGILWRGIVHDLSKLSPSEWIPYVNKFYGDSPLTPYGEQCFDAAWLHHQKRNKHHWQYWMLQEDSGKQKTLPMPDVYQKEMLCDWRGAGRAIKGRDETKEWYLANKDKMQLHPDTREWIEWKLGVISH